MASLPSPETRLASAQYHVQQPQFPLPQMHPRHQLPHLTQFPQQQPPQGYYHHHQQAPIALHLPPPPPALLPTAPRRAAPLTPYESVQDVPFMPAVQSPADGPSSQGIFFPIGSGTQTSARPRPALSPESSQADETEEFDEHGLRQHEDGEESSNLESSSPEAGRSANTTRQVARGPTPGEWESLRPLLENLYMRQKYTLKDLHKFMELHHGFTPTVRMYKRQFEKWMWCKYNSKRVRDIRARMNTSGGYGEGGIPGLPVDNIIRSSRRSARSRRQYQALEQQHLQHQQQQQHQHQHQHQHHYPQHPSQYPSPPYGYPSYRPSPAPSSSCDTDTAAAYSSVLGSASIAPAVTPPPLSSSLHPQQPVMEMQPRRGDALGSGGDAPAAEYNPYGGMLPAGGVSPVRAGVDVHGIGGWNDEVEYGWQYLGGQYAPGNPDQRHDHHGHRGLALRSVPIPNVQWSGVVSVKSESEGEEDNDGEYEWMERPDAPGMNMRLWNFTPSYSTRGSPLSWSQARFPRQRHDVGDYYN